jgi:AcrR family transcriptional regulator
LPTEHVEMDRGDRPGAAAGTRSEPIGYNRPVNSENATNGRPRGRDQVRAAVLAATRDLVAERGLDRFSVRDIAARAGINHALVHRYFGTKAGVVEEMLAEESKAVADAVAESGAAAGGSSLDEIISSLLEVLSDRPTYWRALANAVLDEPDAAVPGTSRTTDMFAGLWRGGEPGSADATAVAGVTVLGWLIFGDFMVNATDADSDAVRRLVVEQVCELVAPGFQRSRIASRG